MGEVCASSFRGLRSALGLGSSKSPLPRRMCSAHVIGAISRGRSMHMRKLAIVSGMEASACAGFGLRDVHVKTNGCFWSLLVQHDCHPRLHVCISCRSQRKHARHIASVRDMLHIESSRRFWRVCVKACRAHMRIKGSRLGRSCARKIGPSFSTCIPIFGL